MSLSFNINDLFTYAQMMIDALWPVALIGVGLAFGIALVNKIAGMIKSAL